MLTSGFLTKRFYFFIYFKACPRLSNPWGGSVSTPEGIEFEDEAIFECKPGFELVGSSQIYCQSTGSWSGDEPTCSRSLLKEKSERIDKKLPNFAEFPFISFSAKIEMKKHITVEPHLKLIPFQELAVHLSHNHSLPVCRTQIRVLNF